MFSPAWSGSLRWCFLSRLTLEKFTEVNRIPLFLLTSPSKPSIMASFVQVELSGGRELVNEERAEVSSEPSHVLFLFSRARNPKFYG